MNTTTTLAALGFLLSIGCAHTEAPEEAKKASASALDGNQEVYDATVNAEAWTTSTNVFHIRYPEVLWTTCGQGADVNVSLTLGDVQPDHIQVLKLAMLTQVDGDGLSVGAIDFWGPEQRWQFTDWLFGTWTNSANWFDMNQTFWALDHDRGGAVVEVPLFGSVLPTPEFGEVVNSNNTEALACAAKLTIRLRPPAGGGDFGG